VTLRAGQTVVIFVDGYGGQSGLFTLNITPTSSPPSDAGEPDA
jgi:hypothetical protein